MEAMNKMRKTLYLVVLFLGLLRTSAAQTIPKQLWGTWVVRRELPTTAVSCWDEKAASALIGTEIEYSKMMFRWNKVVTKNPDAKTTTITADQFHDENSGGSSSGSQVTFQQLGIKIDKVAQVVVQHPDANITEATTEIPGDTILIKDKNTIIFSVCAVYFEATRKVPPVHN